MITIKEEFVGCTKYLRAQTLGGDAAIVLWLALKNYAAQNPMDGFIHASEVQHIAGKPKSWKRALKALLTCGVPQDDGTIGSGLLDEEPTGYRLHDWLHHNASSDEEKARREAARRKKALQRARALAASMGVDVAGWSEARLLELKRPRDMSPNVPRDKRDMSLGTESKCPPGQTGTNRDTSPGCPLAGARAHPRADAGTLPNPTQPNPTREQIARARIPFPLDFDPGKGFWTGSQVNPERHADYLAQFSAYWLGKPDVQTLAEWRSKYRLWGTREAQTERTRRETRADQTPPTRQAESAEGIFHGQDLSKPRPAFGDRGLS